MSSSFSMRSALTAAAAMLFGLGLYHFDNWHEAMPNSWVKISLDDFEILLMGPGMGALAWFIAEHFRHRERRHQGRLDQEFAGRFVLLGQVAASVAHEIRNPLHNLRLIVEELQAQAHPADRAALDRLDANVLRLDHAVALVYELARPRSQADHGDVAVVSVVPLVEAAIAEAAQCGARRPDFRHLLPDQPVLVDGRAAALQVVLGNLVRNAVEAAGDGAVEISYRGAADSWSVNISNAGALPDEVLAGGSPRLSQKPTGLGVGLGIARHLTALGGGQLALSSGDGVVCARLTLPLALRR